MDKTKETMEAKAKGDIDLSALIFLGDRYPDLMQMSLEQLRLLLLLDRLGGVSKVAKFVGKDASSVTKTVNSAENKLIRIFQEQVLNRSLGRSRLEFMRPVGDNIAKFAESVMSSAYNFSREAEQSKQDTEALHIGLVTFQMPFLAKINEKFVLQAEKKRVRSTWRLKHLNTSEIAPSLLDRDVDTVIGGDVFGHEHLTAPHFENIDFIPHRKEFLGVMGDIKLSSPCTSLPEIIDKKIPVLLPTKGAIYNFLEAELGFKYPGAMEDAFNTVLLCNDINFMIELLRLRIYEACIITVPSIYNILRKQKEFKDMSFYPLEGTSHVMKYGVFLRKGERNRYPASHPLSLFWDCCESLSRQET